MQTMMNTPLTLVSVLERAAKYFGNVEVVSRLPDRSIHRTTWGGVYQRALRLAECLQSAGIRKGDRVATLMWNHYVHLEVHYGVPVAGGILHALNLRLHPDEIAWIANHAGDRFLIVDDVLLPVLEKFKAKVKFERIFVVSHCGQPVAREYENYEDWLKQARGSFEYPEISENDGAAMCYTSGTTGSPKGVIYSHRSEVLHSLVQALPDCCALSQHDVALLGSPMFHANGWGLPYTAAMVGAKLILPGPHLDADSLLELIDKEAVTMSCAVPTVWLPVLAALEKRGPNWRPARDIRILCGGTAPPESLMRGLDRHGFHLIHAWGMTETSPLGTTMRLKPEMLNWPEERQYAQRCKQGWASPLIDVRVVNDQGEAGWDGQTMGELEVRGPWVAASYFNAPGTENRWSEDGWFRTGDVAIIDPDGCVKLVDRRKDMIKSGGEWISSVDVENALMGHPAVKEAGVVGVQHVKWQERPLAVVVLKDGAKATADELREFLARKFANWQLPDDFVFVSELPHTSTGKLQKSALRKRYADWKWTQAEV
ncbi:MAG TPA: long-chain fatty acid--CoA ligase [Candidatus Angelobacter sp.]|nr:long-chain fatty acid--CoA ligase [Candidatus Angelobacter sp.]